jgi:Helix-turn-helix domain
MKLTKQQAKVFAYIRDHRGATTSDIQRDTRIGCPSARIAEMRKKGVNIFSIGQKRYEGSRAFEMYAMTEVPKPRQVVELQPNGSVKVTYVSRSAMRSVPPSEQ